MCELAACRIRGYSSSGTGPIPHGSICNCSCNCPATQSRRLIVATAAPPLHQHRTSGSRLEMQKGRERVGGREGQSESGRSPGASLKIAHLQLRGLWRSWSGTGGPPWATSLRCRPDLRTCRRSASASPLAAVVIVINDAPCRNHKMAASSSPPPLLLLLIASASRIRFTPALHAGSEPRRLDGRLAARAAAMALQVPTARGCAAAGDCCATAAT